MMYKWEQIEVTDFQWLERISVDGGYIYRSTQITSHDVELNRPTESMVFVPFRGSPLED